MKDIFLSWIQWSGKGTQADLLMEKFPDKFKYFETWGILRALSSNDNAIWNYIRKAVESWELIKDWVTVSIFNVFLQTVEKWDILLVDWVLRKMWQTQDICKEMQNAGREFIVLHFDLPDEIVYQRLSSRIVCWKCGNNANWWTVWWICEKCGWKLIRREDDSNIEAIKTRIEAFHKETEPWLKWVEENWRLVHIDANRGVEEIFQDVVKYVK
jgi:adenylate kinase